MKIDSLSAAAVAAAVDEGSFDAAARRLQVTPSAVSQRIKALEQQIGRVLLVRTRPVRATAAGEAVIRLARRLALLEHDTAGELGLDEGSGQAVTVPLAVNADSLATWFLAPLARVAARRAVVFDLHRDDQDFTAGLLESGTVMAAVTSQRTPVAGCTVTALGRLRYEAVATPGFVDRWFPAGLDGHALEHAPFVDFDRRDALQHGWLRERGVPPRAPRHHVPASHDFARAIELGLGWGLLPTLQSTDALADRRLVRLGGDPIDVPLYWQQWSLSSALLDEIAAEVAAEAARALTD